MGCGNPKEKIEDELIKAKFERIKVQMERENQIKLLEEITGKHINLPKIPDYMAPITIKKKFSKAKSSTSLKIKRKVNKERSSQRSSKKLKKKKKSYYY